MKRTGILGFGFMGNMHFNNYSQIEDIEVAAICDINEERFSGKGAEAGNIEGAQKELDLTNIQTYSDAEKMFSEADLDAVSITLPTYLHHEYTLKALNAGLDVLCEKPMAMDSKQAAEMVDAAKKTGQLLQVGHCIRFWPEYAKAKQIIDSGQYGKLKVAAFNRLSLTPTWSWDNWLLDEKRSGGALLDLHIHDTDFVQYLFGMPRAISTTAVKGPTGGYDHAATQYFYDDEKAVTTQGGWIMTPSFGFQMSFEIILEKAAITYDLTREPTFKICPHNAEAFTPELQTGDGYLLELKHFAKAVNRQNVPEIITPDQSMNSVILIEAEKKSAQTSQKVDL